MSADNVKIEASWKEVLIDEFSKDYFFKIRSQLIEEKKKGLTIYPPGPEIFNAFDSTPFQNVKVVILGQDPYHGPGQAHGLCFSVKSPVKPPPSLVNIYKEINNDIGLPIAHTGDLSSWTKQGVFLLNAMLTVRAREAGSHKALGWQNFTDAVIKALSDKRENLIFLLWGKFAQSKSLLIDPSKHHVLKAPHPSPFSAHSGFFGSKHFSKTNQLLKDSGQTEIDWSVD